VYYHVPVSSSVGKTANSLFDCILLVMRCQHLSRMNSHTPMVPVTITATTTTTIVIAFEGELDDANGTTGGGSDVVSVGTCRVVKAFRVVVVAVTGRIDDDVDDVVVSVNDVVIVGGIAVSVDDVSAEDVRSRLVKDCTVVDTAGENDVVGAEDIVEVGAGFVMPVQTPPSGSQ